MKLEAAEADDDVAPLTGLRLRDQAGTHFRRYPHCVDLFNGYFFLNLSTPGLENADGGWLAAFGQDRVGRRRATAERSEPGQLHATISAVMMSLKIAHQVLVFGSVPSKSRFSTEPALKPYRRVEMTCGRGSCYSRFDRSWFDAVWCQAGLSATDFACQRLLSHEGSTKQQMDFQPHTGYC